MSRNESADGDTGDDTRSDYEQRRDRVLGQACCPRCGEESLTIKSSITEGYDTVGYHVTHANSDVSCSLVEWPVYDLQEHEGDLNQRGQGLSICHTCLSWTQHLEPDDDGDVTVGSPRRDDDGNPICSRCSRRN